MLENCDRDVQGELWTQQRWALLLPLVCGSQDLEGCLALDLGTYCRHREECQGHLAQPFCFTAKESMLGHIGSWPET
jgi:hypothetical protein